jgi:hypothetical protein
VGSVTGGGVTRLLSGRTGGFFGGQINVGAIATMIIRATARMTRRSKSTP